MALRSLRTLKSLTAVLTLVATLSIASPASASIIWNWSFGGTEAGTFTTTDGDTSTVSFTILAISVTASSTPSLVGSLLIETLSPQGFQWNGSAPTMFFRSVFTNGSNFFAPGLDRRYLFHPDQTSLSLESSYTTLAAGALTLSPDTPLPLAPPPPPPPPPPTTVPEPMSLTLLALGCAGMAVRQRSRRQ